MASTKNTRTNQLFTNDCTAMFVTAALLVLVGTQSLLAQAGRANISGTVTDSQGAVVSGAIITATNVATGVATPTTTNESGAYNIIQLVPGAYTIRAEKEGFGAQQKENITLVAEQNLGANFVLLPGQVSQKVTVEAGAELVHTESAELSQTINEHAIDELPLNGRNPASLVLLTPGTMNAFTLPGGGAQTYTTFPTDSAASTNGGRQGSTLYLLDGAYNEDNYVLAAAPFPNPDATKEFTVIGNNFDARYGFAPGGVVSIVTKSGTNNWNGDIFEFYRDAGFNAEDYFTHKTNEIHRHQFGGSLGGPVVKDKFFVFGNYQGTLQRVFNAGSGGYVWTPAMVKNGDFSVYCQTGFTNGLCNDRVANPANPGDPYVTHQIWTPNPTGYGAASVLQSTALANPGMYYPGNQIPVSSFSPQAVALANTLSTGLTPLNQYGSIEGVGYPTINDYSEGTVRGDYDLNDHNRISGTMFLNYFNQPAFSSNAVASNRSWITDWQNYVGTWTWTINPHMVNSATGSYSRMYDTSNSGLKVNGKRICFSQFIATSDPSNPDFCSIPHFVINGGYQSAGSFPLNGGDFNGVNRWTGGFSDNLNISEGKHLIAVGMDLLRQYWNENTDYLEIPLLAFSGGPQGQFTGNGFSDFLLGDLGSFEQGGGESNVVNAWMIAPYVADQIKLTPTLTVSAGLRWEPWISPVPESGREAIWDPGHQSTRYPNAPLGMLFPGDPGVPGTGTPSDYKRFFDPRLGLAWAPRALPHTSIRAAFGIYATPIDYSSWNHASDLAPFSPTYSFNAGGNLTAGTVTGIIPIIPFADPWSVYFPLHGRNPFPPFTNADTSPPSSATFSLPIGIQSGFALNYTDGRTYTWNMSIEHQFGASWVVKAAYVASESDHQSYANDANLGLPICGPVSPTCAAVTSNPRVNPLFTQVLLDFSNANASYQSGQFTLERRLAQGLQFTANYTYSHTIDIANAATTAFDGALDNPGCAPCNRGNSYIDTPQIFVADWVYETPTRWQGGIAPVKLVLESWQISGIYRAQSGQPFSIDCGCTTSWQDDGTDYPDFAPGVTHVHVNPGNLTHYVVASDFVNPPQGRDGDIGRNPVGLFGPGINTWDLGMSKNIEFTERYRFQLRWEMFNAFNRVTFSDPNNNTSSSSFGLINSTNSNYPSRVMQLAGKLYF